MSLTNDERGLVLDLADVWNAFLKLPVEHAMDQQEFCSLIHRCQDMLLARPARRDLNNTFELTPPAGHIRP